MIPIRDENPSGTYPLVTVALIAANVLAFLFQASLGEKGLEHFIGTFALVPAKVWYVRRISGELGSVEGVKALFPFLSSMFLHGGFMHLVGNVWFLWLFGDNVEDRFGHAGFVLFYLVCGIGAAAAHVFLAGPDMIPMLGASGAISGVLGAYLVCFPRARVLTIIPIFIFLHFTYLRAYVFMFLWLFGQILGAVAAEPGAPGIAWWAHLGGFALGGALALLWPKCKSAKQSKYEATPDLLRTRRRGT